MSRTGVEAKLPWQAVPKGVRAQVDAALGAKVVRAARVWGGYSPTPTYRLALSDGRQAFFKGTYQESNQFSKNALRGEERVYQQLSPLLGRWMPELYRIGDYEDWHYFLMEDVGPQSVPPWTPQKTKAITQAIAEFHQASLGANFPDWLRRPADYLPEKSWVKVQQESEDFHKLAALADEGAFQALEWFQAITPIIEKLLQNPALKAEPYAILHGDLRSDNLRFNDKHLRLFDWPAIVAGRPEWDIVVFAQTVSVEGGPRPEQVLNWYNQKLRLDEETVKSALAYWLTFFAGYAWQPEVPGLPRLRRFQRQQLGTLILWVAREWQLETPAWANRLLV